MAKNYTYNQLVETLRLNSPLLMLDEAMVADDCLTGKASKLMSINEPVFQGHFPGQPVTPGVLQVAAMAQLSNLIFRLTVPVIAGTRIVLRQIRRLKFRKPVLPGMAMLLETGAQRKIKSQWESRGSDGASRISSITLSARACSAVALVLV